MFHARIRVSGDQTDMRPSRYAWRQPAGKRPILRFPLRSAFESFAAPVIDVAASQRSAFLQRNSRSEEVTDDQQKTIWQINPLYGSTAGSKCPGGSGERGDRRVEQAAG